MTVAEVGEDIFKRPLSTDCIGARAGKRRAGTLGEAAFIAVWPAASQYIQG